MNRIVRFKDFAEFTFKNVKSLMQRLFASLRVTGKI